MPSLFAFSCQSTDSHKYDTEDEDSVIVISQVLLRTTNVRIENCFCHQGPSGAVKANLGT